MERERESLKPIEGAAKPARQRLPLRDEFTLALLPTLVVLAVFALVELLSRQRLLFASLAGSAFLIYLDPQHGANRMRTLVLSQMFAAVIGFAAFFSLGLDYPYWAGGAAMVVTIALMIMLEAVHPPAVSTSRVRVPGRGRNERRHLRPRRRNHGSPRRSPAGRGLVARALRAAWSLSSHGR